MPYRLYRIRMKKDILLSEKLTDFDDRLNRSYFIVGQHNRNQFSIGADSFFHTIDLNYSGAANRQIGNIGPNCFIDILKKIC